MFNRELTPLKDQKHITRSQYHTTASWNEVQSVQINLPDDQPDNAAKEPVAEFSLGQHEPEEIGKKRRTR